MIESDMTSYKSGYYQLFKEEYQKEYGSSYPESSTISKKDMFYKLADEIYSEISSEYNELFPTAASGNDLIEAFLKEIPIFKSSKSSFPNYCVQAFNEGKPFVLQRIQRKICIPIYRCRTWVY